MALVRVAALALAWWLAASTTLYVLARVTRVPSLVRAVEWATLPSVRRLVDGLAATTIAAGSVLGPTGVAAASPADDTAVVVQLGSDDTSATTAPRYRPRPAGSDHTVGTAPAARAAPVTPAPPTPTAMPSAGSAGDDDSSPTTAPRRAPEKAADYVVQPGDNLWRIAERHLATLTGQPAADLAIAEVRSYWARLVDHTQTTTGRRTGRPHCIEIWYAADRNTLYLLAGGGTSSDWVRNLCADPNVLVEVGGDIRPGRARVLGTGDEADTARALVFGKYAPRYRGDLTGWRQSALPIAVDLGNS